MNIVDIIHWGASIVSGGQAAIGSIFGIDVAAVNADLAVLNSALPSSGAPASSRAPAGTPTGTDQARTTTPAGAPVSDIFKKYGVAIAIGMVLIIAVIIWLIMLALGGEE